ncbi:MAG: hypothetical protein QOE54_6487 [Streptosporangiaceae bacterium]|jgi:hypothetical protein|nr:hypothetical protein [Streptosporangiaceae bacterium]MDX6434121.1 hypothetical protein [Streptosporangiaceae bacterium]
MLGMIRKMGISSDVLYVMGFGSIAMSVASWTLSQRMEAAGTDRADRWGIFVGEWAPAFFALGTAMRLEEQWGPRGQHEEFSEMRERSRNAMPVV